MTRKCGDEIPMSTRSSGNVLQVVFRSDGSVSHRGFTASWSTEQPAKCGGVFNSNRARPLNGMLPRISSPMNAEFNYDNLLLCQWTLSPRQDVGSLKLMIDPIYMESGSDSGECPHDRLSVIRGDLKSGSILGIVNNLPYG